MRLLGASCIMIRNTLVPQDLESCDLSKRFFFVEYKLDSPHIFRSEFWPALVANI